MYGSRHDLQNTVFFQLLCAHAPRSFPIVDSLCVVLRDDLVAALTKLVQGLRDQLSPKHICTFIPSCVEK